MTEPLSVTGRGVRPHYKVRVVLPGATLHLASRNVPQRSWLVGTGEAEVDADWIEDPRCGDTLGYIDWSQVIGLTWRWSE